jgi:hypothetical protein
MWRERSKNLMDNYYENLAGVLAQLSGQEAHAAQGSVPGELPECMRGTRGCFLDPVEGVWRCFDDRSDCNWQENFEDFEDVKEWLE